MAGKMPSQPPLTLAQLYDTPAEADVDVVVELAGITPGGASARLLEPDAEKPFTAFRETNEVLTIRWDDQTEVVMAERGDLLVGAVVWVRGTLGYDNDIAADLLALITAVATVRKAVRRPRRRLGGPAHRRCLTLSQGEGVS
jgi:hypothetical protein